MHKLSSSRFGRGNDLRLFARAVINRRPATQCAFQFLRRQSPTPRRFEFIGFWGYLVFLVYSMRRVNCKQCGVVVEEVPWGMGKHTSTKVHMHFLGHWARKLSWKETAEEFRTSWDKVHDAVAYLVGWGLEHRVLGAIRAIGVDEIQYGKG